MSLFESETNAKGKTKAVKLELPVELVESLKAQAAASGKSLEEAAAEMVQKNAPKPKQELPEQMIVKLTTEEAWLLKCLKILHFPNENPFRVLLRESRASKPDVWKQIESDGKKLSTAQFNHGKGKKSRTIAQYHEQVRVKSTRGRKPKK